MPMNVCDINVAPLETSQRLQTLKQQELKWSYMSGVQESIQQACIVEVIIEGPYHSYSYSSRKLIRHASSLTKQDHN